MSSLGLSVSEQECLEWKILLVSLCICVFYSLPPYTMPLYFVRKGWDVKEHSPFSPNDQT